MSVFRIERTKDYTVMSNCHLRDKRLSLKAKGLLSQMLSLPEDWDYTLTGLAYINLESKDAIRSAVNELESAGYIQRHQTVPRLEKLVATIRSREISCCLVLLAQSQLKAIYKDNADTIIGNMDSKIFLGGSEPTTLKELNQSLGKETIDTFNTGESRGKETSHSLNYQKLGKDLASVDELAVLDGGKCILQLRGVRPFKSDKFDITKHPNYKYLADFDKRNTFDIEKFLSTRLKPKPDEAYEVFSVDESELSTTAQVV